MKNLTIALVLALISLACNKKDAVPKLNKDKCTTAGYSSLNFYDEFTVGHGLAVTYYPIGLVKTMKAAITLNHFSGVDSIYYSMAYSANGSVVVNATKKHFTIVLPPPTPTNPYDPWNGTLQKSNEPDEKYVIRGTFDVKNKRLTSISGPHGTFSMKYDKNRIVSFGEWSINWGNSNTNIISIGKDNPGEEDGIVEYFYGDEAEIDSRMEAKHQMYMTTGYMIHEYFNLAESCRWIPLDSKNVVLVYATYTGFNPAVGPLPAGQYHYSDHVVDAHGYLQSYKMDWPKQQTIRNFWECGKKK